MKKQLLLITSQSLAKKKCDSLQSAFRLHHVAFFFLLTVQLLPSVCRINTCVDGFFQPQIYICCVFRGDIFNREGKFLQAIRDKKSHLSIGNLSTFPSSPFYFLTGHRVAWQSTRETLAVLNPFVFYQGYTGDSANSI